MTGWMRLCWPWLWRALLEERKQDLSRGDGLDDEIIDSEKVCDKQKEARVVTRSEYEEK